MDIKKDYIYVILAYLIVILYVIFVNDTIITIILVVLLMVYHFFTFTGIKERFFKDKENSITLLQRKLDKSKIETEKTYRRFISLSTTLGSGVIMVNEEGIINFANKDIKTYFEIDFTNKDYKALVEIKPLYKFINQGYLLEKSLREQIEYNSHYYDLINTPFFEDNLFKGNLIIVHDITLLKTAENFQKQFTADVSHELKTPLAAIKGLSEILERDKDISIKDRKEFISLINKESSRMETILNDLLIISKMDRLDYELKLNKIDIKDIIDESARALKRDFEQKSLKLKTNIQSCIMQLDKNKFGQVMLNIVKNAINYTDKGMIEIEGFIDKDRYLISIKDTGIGIKKSDLEKIFRRFYRVDNTRSRETGGSGLGLSISKNVIIRHDGEISVESKINNGTTFFISLPIKR